MPVIATMRSIIVIEQLWDRSNPTRRDTSIEPGVDNSGRAPSPASGHGPTVNPLDPYR